MHTYTIVLRTRIQLFKYEDRYIINPGSATGAFSTTSNASKPSFVLMNIENAAAGSNGSGGGGGSAKLFVYEIDEAGSLQRLGERRDARTVLRVRHVRRGW